MASSIEKLEGKEEIRVEHHIVDPKDVSGFTYEDPKTMPKKSREERKLLVKADLLIVGMTSLVFLVNQWVSPLCHPMSWYITYSIYY
jgi:hypothetical protein